MENKLSCAIVRDLLPSYIDGLTCEETSNAVAQHVETCTGCKETLCSMKAQQPPIDKAAPVEFLKKIQKEIRRRSWLNGSFIATIVLFAVFLGLCIYRILPQSLVKATFTIPVTEMWSQSFKQDDDASGRLWAETINSNPEEVSEVMDILSSITVQGDVRNVLPFYVGYWGKIRHFDGRNLMLEIGNQLDGYDYIDISFIGKRTIHVTDGNKSKFFHTKTDDGFDALYAYFQDHGEYAPHIGFTTEIVE